MHGGGFFFQAFVYLLAAVISVPLAKRLGLGSVLGYLAAGAVIGPHVLGLVGHESGDVMHFAEFGVVMMLFLIGLELQPSRLWRMRSMLLGLGGLQVAVSAVALGALALALGLAVRPALAVGLILALSSTAIVLQTLNEKGTLKTPAGQGCFSVLLFQDIAVIPILALLPLLATAGNSESGAVHAPGGSDSLPGWQQALLVVGVVVLMAVAGRYLLRPVLRFIANTRLREIFTAATLLLVIGAALLMEVVGLSPALGTFVAGMVLADSEYRHELEADIEPFKGLLLGVFFIAVGASIDFALVAHQPGLIASLVGALVVIKLIVLFALARAFRYETREALQVGVALAQGGEFAFVLFSFSAQAGVLSGAVVSPLVVVVALSMVVTPVLIALSERLVVPRLGRGSESTESRAHDVRDEDNPVIVAGFGRFGQVVSRLLTANGIGNTVLDNDPAHIEMLRRFGQRCFYGDASRQDLLHAAGARKARLLVVAIDDQDRAREIVASVRDHFPNLAVVVRAFDRRDAQDHIQAQADAVVRETFGSALHLGVMALRQLGYRAHQAYRAGRTFKHHDEETLRALVSAREDVKLYVSEMHRRRDELERVMQLDHDRLGEIHDEAWDGAPREASISTIQSAEDGANRVSS